MRLQYLCSIRRCSIIFSLLLLSWFPQAHAQTPSQVPTPSYPGLQVERPPGPIPPGPLAPPSADEIEGINFDEDASNVSAYQIPPDPIGAAGPSHIVSVVNSSIEWHTKGGTQQNSQSLKSFFISLSPATNTFDPKVIYDQHAGRFVVVTLEKVDNGENNTGDPDDKSSIFVAVSDDSNPEGTWYQTEINSKHPIGGIDHWADYPGLAVDEEVIYITNNMFQFLPGTDPGGSYLWIIKKSPFYSGGTPVVNQYDPPTAVGKIAVTMQPAHIFGTPSSSSLGTFLVRYSGYSSGGNEQLSIIRVDNPTGTPSFDHQFVSLGDIDDIASYSDLPDAPQQGSSTGIEVNDRRALHAVWRNDALWMTTTVVPPSGDNAGQATAHWVKIDTSTLSPLSLSDQGDIGGEDIATGTYTFFPSIAVDSSGNMGVGFAASASTIYAGAYYTGRLSTDTAGTVQSFVTLAAGLDSYVRTFGGRRNRWGDYSGISVDPSDDKTFWVFNQYALTQASSTSDNGRWGTRWGSFSFQAQITASKTGDYAGSSTTPGATNVHFLQIGLQADTAAATISAVKAAFTAGSTAVDSDIASFDVYHDADNDGTVTGGDTLLGSATFSGGVATVSGLSFEVTTTEKRLLLVLDIDSNADTSHDVGLRLADATYLTASYGSMASTNFPIANASDSSLPVELSAFTATATEKGVQLYWRTETEVDNVGFQVYRSVVGSDRSPVAFVAGTGGSGHSTEYEYMDDSLHADGTYLYYLEDVDLRGNRRLSEPVQVVFAPRHFRLLPNYPNPFNPETWLPYELAAPADVVIRIYDALGRLVRELDFGRQEAGAYLTQDEAAHWNGRSDAGEPVSSGLYLYQLRAGDFVAVRRMVILK